MLNFTILSTLGENYYESTAESTALTVTFSIVVPTCNRVISLKRTLDSLFGQHYSDYEIIVVDDGSTDGTSAYLVSLPPRPNLRVITQANKGPAAARNAGIAAANGAFIACTDDDCVVPPDWLQKFAQAFEQTGADFLGGTVRNCIPDNLFSEVSQEITNYFVTHFGSAGNSTAFLTSNNIAYKADELRKAGGFDSRFRRAGGEERALHFNIMSNKGKGKLLPDNIIEHYHNLTFSGFLRQQMNYGRGGYILYNVAGKEFRTVPQRIQLSVYLNMLLYFLDRNGFLKGLPMAGLAVVAQMAASIGYVAEAAESRKSRQAGA